MRRLRFLAKTFLVRVIRLSVRNTSIPLVKRSRPLQDSAGSLGHVTPEVLNQGLRLACRFVVNRVELLALLAMVR